MENRVHFARLRQIQLVRHNAHSIHHSEQPREFERKLMILATDNRLLNIRLKTEEYLITHLKSSLCSVFISLRLHPLLHPQ